MGKQNKGAAGAVSGAAAGFQMGGLPGAIGGGLIGGLMGNGTGGSEPQKVNPVDPAFMTSLYNQSMGTEKTAADLKMKAAFDQTLAQQVSAARAARGVNPALLQRNVARLASEQGAKATGMMAEENLKNQADARTKYLQAVQINQQAELENAKNATAADVRDNAQLGALLNGMGAIGSTFATAKPTETPSKNNIDLNKAVIAPPQNSVQAAAENTNAYTMGAKEYSDGSPDLRAMSQSDERSKTKIQKEMVVVSDERQKDLIKNESLPQNGNMGMQNQQAMQPQGQQAPPMAAFAQQAPVPQAAQPVPASPAPQTAAQTALGQANASMAKGGTVRDLQTQTMTLGKVANGPSQDEIQNMLADAQRRETRNWDNSVDQSADENYAANMGRWNARQAVDREAFAKQKGEVEANNQNINAERMARLSKFYTGNSNTNTNDLAARYQPKEVLANSNFHAAQNQQAALGIKNQTSGALGFFQNPKAMQAAALAGGLATGGALYGAGAIAPGIAPALLQRSDERSKENIAPQSKAGGDSMNPQSFLDKLNAYSYEYKQGQKQNPNAGEGRYLSPMAQEVEAAGPVGKSMVQTGPDGMKSIDYGKGFGTILAAQVQLNERLKQIEAKKGKV